MTLRLPIGYSDFQEIIENELVLVDKTLMIKTVLDDAKILLFTRPRRFGKTLNLSMLYYFFSCQENDKTDLFTGMNIKEAGERYLQHQGQYPVIFITLKSIKQATFESALETVAAIVAECYLSHRQLLESDQLLDAEKTLFHRIIEKQASDAELQRSLYTLSRWLHAHTKQKIVILIDEYDAPLHSAYLNGYYKEMIDFMREFLSAGLKDNVHLYKAAMTGILRVAKENIFSGLNNLAVYSFLDIEYAQYFGFTETETNALFKQAGLDQDLQAIKKWYNGYQVNNLTLYNPWSIINCIKKQGRLELYWVNTSDNALIKSIVAESVPQLKEDFETLMAGQAIQGSINPHLIFKDLSKSRVACLTLLVMSGYLNAVSEENESGDRLHVLRIPNQEVMRLFHTTIVDWISGAEGIEWFVDFLRYLTSGDIPRFEAALQQIALNVFSYYDVKGYKPENFFHGFTLGMIVTLQKEYVVLSNRESGLGRYDIALIPKQPDTNKQAIVFEFKSIDDNSNEALEAAAQTALAQINTKAYEAELKAFGAEQILKLGVAFCGKSLRLVCEN